MDKIESLHALEILDSRGVPTVEVFLQLKNKTVSSKVPSGASTGEHEALELRDGDKNRYFSKGVLKAVQNIEGPIHSFLKGKSVLNQKDLDTLMIEKDGTSNKSTFGANAILGVSMAIAKARAFIKNQELFESISSQKILPVPMMNIINGGAHADSSLDIQEFMIRPHGLPCFKEALRCGSEIFHTLKRLLKESNYSTGIGDEGGFAPMFSSCKEALDFIMLAIEKSGYKPQKEVSIALDIAASEFYDKKTQRYVEKKKKLKGKDFIERTSSEFIDYLEDLTKNYPIDSIEDGLDENDWEGWKLLSKRLKNIQIVGDDIFVTNEKFLKKGIKEEVANAILIKLNQIGTVTETLEVIKIAKKHNYKTIISHRSGETCDTFIADLAVSVGSGQIKTGSLSRSERIAKYNRLLEIERMLKNPVYGENG